MDLIEEFYEQKEKNEKHNFIMNVLFKLHSRSVQISKEVLVLLKNGFPDGALARWRSLHENNVIFQILTKNFEDIDFTFDLIKRFMDYSEIERQKEAIKYQNAAPKLGLDKFDVNELQEHEKRKKDILSLYGNDFEKPNFWAKPIFKYEPKVIYFSHLEREAQLDTLNPYYNQSNYQVHTSPKGIFQSIGFIENFNQQTFYLFGGSNYGLSIPGQLTAISLFQTTTQFLTLNPNIDTLVIAEAISMMVNDCIEEFHNIQDEIEKEEADKSNE
ncbi:DUF5677 domain-containing protein [Mesobacillus sp. LC4]